MFLGCASSAFGSTMVSTPSSKLAEASSALIGDDSLTLRSKAPKWRSRISQRLPSGSRGVSPDSRRPEIVTVSPSTVIATSDGLTPGTDAVSTKASDVSRRSTARPSEPVGGPPVDRGRTKLSSRRLFIASRRLMMSPHGSHRELLIVVDPTRHRRGGHRHVTRMPSPRIMFDRRPANRRVLPQ